MPGAYTLGGTGSSPRCFIAIATAESPSNGTRPVSISYSTIPTEYRSDGGPTTSPRACSGERYWAVPTIEPTSVICEAPARAMPKSVTFSRPSRDDHHVVRLDVAVHDAVVVGEPERGEDLRREVDRAVRLEAAALVDHVLEGRPLEVLHRDVVRAIRDAAVVDRDDVRVVQPRRRLCLAAEALDELLVLGVPLREHLDRDLAVQGRVLGEPDRRHAAGAEPA